MAGKKWKKGYSETGRILRNPSQIATGDDCCCGGCCALCPDLEGYSGDLCATISGALTCTSTLIRTSSVGQCDRWINSGSVDCGPTPCADFPSTWDIDLLCNEGQTPRLVVNHVDDPTCNLANRGVDLEADTLNCSLGLFVFVKTIAIVGGSCLCVPASVTITITKGACP